MKHNLDELDTKVAEITKIVSEIGDADYWEGLRNTWRNPPFPMPDGWTTLAEYLLVRGHLDLIMGTLEQVRESQGNLRAGCEAVKPTRPADPTG